VDAQIALAKSKARYSTGVQFVNEVGEHAQKEVVWTHPQPGKGVVRDHGMLVLALSFDT
jgi:hypothetical protein